MNPAYCCQCISCESNICPDPPWRARYQVLHKTRSKTQLTDVYTTEFDWKRECCAARQELAWGPSNTAKKLGPWYEKQTKTPAKAFVFHESCWILLTRQFEGEKIDFDKLFEVCKDIPGRSYRNLHNDNDRYPLEQPVIDQLQDAETQFPMSKIANDSSKSVLHSDCFDILPLEIRIHISTYLPTVDFLKLRLASRAMVAVFEFQSFWKSRFAVNGDRGFLNYLLADSTNGEKNWRLIYRCTREIDPSHNLRTVQRRWKRVRWLRDRCSMVTASKKQIGSNQTLLTKLRWKGVSTRIRCDRAGRWGRRIWEKCYDCGTDHKPFSQVVRLGDSIIGLAVSILREDTDTYITGFELVNADPETPNTILGYRIPGESVTIDLCGKQLMGFTIIKGHAGIHSIRPIMKKFKNNKASWVGLPQGSGSLVIRRLYLRNGIKAISGEFDYCKMIGLSIA